MKITAILQVAIQSLRRTALRSSLTALGIIVGVAAIILMIALASGARARIDETFAHLSWDYMVVTASMPTQGSSDEMATIPRGQGVTLADYEAIRSSVSGIVAITPRTFLSGVQAKFSSRRAEPRVIGWNAEGFEVNARQVLRGASFASIEVERAASVCLVTESLHRRLFVDADGIGESLLINGTPFVVIGVVADDNPLRSMFSTDGDLAVIVPVTSLLRRLDPAASMDIAFKPRNRSDADRLKVEISDLMERRRGNRKPEFPVFHQMEGIEQRVESSRTMTLLLASIAGVALIVGGIGIMNIMLVSVVERTREIGIRMAVGTHDRDILVQFLIEALVLSVLGGSAGIVLGIASARALTLLNGWPTEITSTAVVAAFLSSAIVGIFFGYYPARQAARMEPIRALRTD